MTGIRKVWYVVGALRGQRRHATLRHKVVSLEDAALSVHSGDTVGVGGFVAQNAPEALLRRLGERFLETGEPQDLTVLFGGGPGDSATKGVSHFGHEGMVKRAIGAHYGQCPMLAKLVLANKIEAYNLPLGAISRMLRAQAAHQPGYLTRVGIGTLVDPDQGGGRLNDKTTGDLVVPIEVEGVRHLLYKAVPINVAFVKGTTADANGNISMENESLYADNFSLAMAAHNSGGVVIAQVERLAERSTIAARDVHIPGAFVDAVVVSQAAEENKQSYFTSFNPFWAGRVKAPQEDLEKLPMTVRKVIARRCAMELRVDDIVNLGIGMPDGVANIASEENILRYITLTTEPGVYGGIGAQGKEFGPASNYEAIVTMDKQFDFYNGGGLNIAFLGMAEVSPTGDINVTRFGNKLTGPGGFIDISQCTSTVVFCGTFTAGGLDVVVQGDGTLKIVKEGKKRKFVNKLAEVTFNGTEAVKKHQRVLYVTERCVFELTPDGLMLTEVAPGIDIKKDILAHMDFTPLGVPNGSEPKLMDPAIFDMKSRMGLKQRLTEINFSDRFAYNEEKNTLMLDLSGVIINTREQIEEADKRLGAFFEEMGKAHVVVNYERFDCRKSLVDAWAEMAARQEKNYLSVKRCVGGTFLRAKVLNGLKIQESAAVTEFKKLDPNNTGYLDYDSALKLFRRLGRFIREESTFRAAFNTVDTKKKNRVSLPDLRMVDAILYRMQA